MERTSNRNRMVFITNSQDINKLYLLTACCKEIANGRTFTTEELMDAFSRGDYGLDMSPESFYKNLSNLKALGFIETVSPGEFSLTLSGIAFADMDNELDVTRQDLLCRAFTEKYCCMVRNNLIMPFSYIENFFVCLEGRVEKIELIPLLFCATNAEFNELLEVVRRYRRSKNPQIIYDYITMLMEQGKITAEDVRIVARRDVTRPTFALKSLGLIEENSARDGEDFYLPAGMPVRLGKFYTLTSIGWRYIVGTIPDDIDISDEEIEGFRLTDVPEEEWPINNQPPKILNVSERKTYSRSAKVAKIVISDSLGHCFFEELEMEHSHTIYKIQKNGKEKYLMQSHHIIPMSFQGEFPDRSLDTTFMSIPVCLVCHAILHSDAIEEKERLVRYIYEKRSDALAIYGINSYDEFKVYYNL